MKNITQYIKRTVIVGLLVATTACAGTSDNGRYMQAGEAQNTYSNDTFYGLGDRY